MKNYTLRPYLMALPTVVVILTIMLWRSDNLTISCVQIGQSWNSLGCPIATLEREVSIKATGAAPVQSPPECKATNQTVRQMATSPASVDPICIAPSRFVTGVGGYKLEIWMCTEPKISRAVRRQCRE